MWLKHKAKYRTIFTFMHVKITPHLNQTNSIDAWLSMRLLLLLLLSVCFCTKFLWLPPLTSPTLFRILCGGGSHLLYLGWYFIYQPKIHCIDECVCVCAHQIKWKQYTQQIKYCLLSVLFVHVVVKVSASTLTISCRCWHCCHCCFYQGFVCACVCDESGGSANSAWNTMIEEQLYYIHTSTRAFLVHWTRAEMCIQAF